MIGQSVLRSFSNIGQIGGARNFAGFPAMSGLRRVELPVRGAVMLSLRAGELLRFPVLAEGARLCLAAFDGQGQRAESAFGLTAGDTLSFADFDSMAMSGWLAARGMEPGQNLRAASIITNDQGAVLRTCCDCFVWLIAPFSAEDLISCRGAGVVAVEHQASPERFALPDPQGLVRDEFTIPRGTAMAYELAPGEKVQIIDIEGQQCSDFQVVTARSLNAGREEFIDSTATRSMVRHSYPAPGLLDKFYDPQMRPILRVLQDTCGQHDTFGLACTARGYEDRGFPGHVNCSDNISEALAPYGVAPRGGWPAINFFWRTWIDAHHQIQTEESHSRPGDFVTMEALEPLVAVSTACPDDIDPINGWNPTDIHVRIYRAQTSIQRAIAYRPKEDAPMHLSQPSPFHARQAPLTDHFAPARDLWLPTVYPAVGTTGEYWACRQSATLQDMSSLRKFDIVGPDAEVLLQKALTRNIAKLSVWRATYALMCDTAGEVIDDGTLFRLAPALFRWCCGSEESGRWLTELAERENLQVRVHDLQGSLPNLALQGPMSRDILRALTFTQPHVPSLDQIKWFGATVARVGDRDGAPFFLSRTGYTGELGYEIFCAARDAERIWDAVMQAGAEHGLAPMGSAALEIIRIEAGLAAAGGEFAPGVDAFEAGLGFAVDLNKTQFIGKEALARNALNPRKVLKGLKFGCDDVPAHGAAVYAGERPVGVITSATRSPMLECAIAMARLNIEHSDTGTKLEVGQLDGRMKRLSAQVCDIPFVDPKRTRARV